MIGQTLGHYRILEKLGAGGMGEVYRAEDLTLKRQVALKVLPPEVSGSREKIERFRREAESLAALDHPNIVTLYSVEQVSTATGEEEGAAATPTELHFLTMQLVDGKPLSELIPEYGLSVEPVVKIGISLVEALRAAHEKGVIHRDLKPANVMIDQQGRAKVLDFGLAKLTRTERDEAASVLATEAMTQEGVILGTIPYMSPEQIQGDTVDRRSDFFSLGVLLYEMLSGERPFTAPNAAALMSSILRDAPSPVTEQRPEVPESLQRLLQKCLEKDPLLRYQTAEEIWLDLREIQRASSSSVSSEIEAAVERVLAKGTSSPVAAATPASGGDSAASVASASSPAPRIGKALPWLAALGICGGLLGTGYILFLANRGEAPPSEVIPAQLVHKQLTSLPGTEQYPSLSPDGEWVIYSAEGPEYQDIHLQSVGGQKSFNLTAGSESDNSQPCFSPDGTRIAFRSSRDGGGIFVMGRTGEAVRRVAGEGFNPTWSPDGAAIAYATESVDLNPLNWEGETQLWRVDVDTGEQEQLTARNAVQPAWSPTGQRIAYVARLGDPTRMDLASISVLGGEPTAITEDEFTEWSPEWSPDGHYLFFASDRSGSMNLWRIAVDETSGRALGPPEPLTTPATSLAHPRVADDGSGIAYSSVFMTQNIQQIEFDVANPTSRDQQLDWVTSGSSLWSSVDPSPDGQHLAFYSRARPEGDLYIIRSDGTGLRQLTGDTAIDRVPRWSPDGEWIAFFSDRSGSLQVWRIRPDGSDLQQLTEHDGHASLVAWSPDGSKIAVLAGLGPDSETVVFDPDKSWSDQEVQILPAPEEEGLRYVVTSWSPDGSMLAGQAGFNNSGLVLYSFVSSSYRRLTDFGEWPVWLPDSQRLLFVSGGKSFFITAIDGSKPEEVFSVSRDVIGPPRVTKDGPRIFFTRRVTEADIWLLAFGDESHDPSR